MGASDPGAATLSGVLDPRAVVVTNSACNAVGYLLVGFGLSRLPCFDGVAWVCAGTACVASLLLDLAGLWGAVLPGAAVLVLSGLQRVCCAAVMVVWLVYLSRLSPRAIAPCCLAGFSLAMLLCVAALSIEGVGKVAVRALLLPASMAVFMRSPRPVPEPSQVPVGASGAAAFVSRVWRVVFVLCAFGVVDWLVTLTEPLSTSGVHALVCYLCTLAVMGALLGASLVKQAFFAMSYVSKLVVPMVIAGLMLVVCVVPASPLGSMLVTVGYSCFDVFCIAMVAVAIARSGVRAPGAFGAYRALECLAPLCAVLILQATSGNDEPFASLFAAATAVVVLLSIVLDGQGVFESGGHNPPKGARAQAMDFALQCEKAVELFGLTPREAEVLGLVSRGRSVPHISERLGISRNTTKTYVARIYEKMGVFERQEMLDVIESLPVEGRHG